MSPTPADVQSPANPPLPHLSLKFTLTGHREAVEVLQISPDHAYALSSGADSQVIIWDLAHGRALQVVKAPFHGPVHCGVWIYTTNAICPRGFAFGCADGSVHYYRMESSLSRFAFVSAQLLQTRAGIEAMAFDSNHNQIGIGSAGCCTLWRLGKKGISQIHASDSGDAIISSLFFTNEGTCLVASFLETCKMVAYRTESWEVIWRRTLRTRIGYAAASPDGTILVSNLEDGIDIYENPPVRLLKSIPLEQQHLRHQVSTLSGGAYIAVGSEKGRPLVINPKGYLQQALPHDSSLVPVVASSSIQEHYIVTAAAEEPYHIKVWWASERDNSYLKTQDLSKSGLPFSLTQVLIISLLWVLIQAVLSNFESILEAGRAVQEAITT